MEQNIEQSKAWGISSLVTGILSILLVLLPYFGLPLAIFSIVAHVKQKKIMPTGVSMGGFVCGILGVILNSIILFMMFIMILLVGVSGL